MNPTPEETHVSVERLAAKQALQRVEPQTMTVARQQPTPADLIHAVIERGVTGDNVAAVEKLVDLYERMQAKEAEKAFAGAFVALQADVKAVRATRTIPNRDGTIRSSFAPFEEIMAEVSPALQRHGFTVTFSTSFDGNRIVKTCTLQHTGGHSRTNSAAVRIGGGPPGCSEAQADGAAGTYAKRMALCDCLNIVVDHDTDADPRMERNEAKVTQAQADELERRVHESNSDWKAFLKFAGAGTFSEIPASKYDELDRMLRRKEAKGK